MSIGEKDKLERSGDTDPTNKLAEALLLSIEPTPPYGTYSIEALIEKLTTLQSILSDEGYDASEEVAISRTFFEQCFDDFESPSLNRTPGSFGFVVPPRIRREVLGESDDYMAEWEVLCPIMKHFNSSVGQRLVIGLPPWIVDSYGIDDDGRCGYMLCAPILGDMWDDLEARTNPVQYYLTAKQILNDVLALAKKLNIQTVGLGAILPRFLLKVNELGDKLDAQGIDLTTGHAGTVWLIGETIANLTERGRKGFNGSIGILGAGSIGIAVIEHLRQNLGYTGKITVFDSRAEPLAKVLELGYENIEVVENEKALIRSSDTVVCAATTTLSFEKLGIETADVDGKDFIDDSQPGCLDVNEVKERGGQLMWVMGQDFSKNGSLTRNTFSYNGFGPIKKNEVWGCELEAYLAYLAEVDRKKAQLTLEQIASLAVSRHVTWRDVRVFSDFAHQHKAQVAKLQAKGKYVDVT